MTVLLWILGLALGILLLGYWGLPLGVWTAIAAGLLLVTKASIWLWAVFVVLAAVANLPWLRQRLLTRPIMGWIQNMHWLPQISDTERAAIEAGTVWVEREFFTGRPNLRRILSEPYPHISPEVQAFLDGPVEQVCRMATDWEIYRRKDLPPEVWAYLKQERFFGLMIPKEYGGLGFTSLAYSAVMNKLASRSFTHVATVGVTNSLGPAKLILRYGTEEQKQHYLPRLATGVEIPCFALTEPLAGSDAASLTSEGVVFQRENGELWLRLNWNKRYITLGAIATLIGLAFRLKDPDNLLGKGEEVGITCALVSTDNPGVFQNRRHDPMGVPFYNSPLEGQDVVVPIGQIIGGVEQAGQGWKMIMQTLAAGRGISFPASCAGVSKLVARVAGAHALVRQQFGLSIGRFGGVEEPLARIAGYTYLVDALRLYTLGAVEQGEQPAVAAAIAKYQSTELTRKTVMDGMDILGGSGICRGPHNLLAHVYTAMPIAITVEGANILTRTLMIYGQGAIRCHPYVYDEILALEQGDLAAFDRVIWAHVGSSFRHFCRVKLLTWTRGRLASSPVPGETARYYQKLQWASALFALLSDVVMVTLGGALKREEKVTGRLADMLSWLYLGSATLWRYEAEGFQPDELPLIHWVMQTVFAAFQEACTGLVDNIPGPRVGRGFLKTVSWALRLSPMGGPPSDALGHEVAQRLQLDRPIRDRLTQGIYLSTHPDEALGRLEEALRLSTQALPLLQGIKLASRSGQLPKQRPDLILETAIEAGLLTQEEGDLLQRAEAARKQAVQVDSFTFQEYLNDGRSMPAVPSPPSPRGLEGISPVNPVDRSP
ncbi:acyl-CoA dehydrogenase [Lyngbya confervoides]|uniref:Acyl-coenzyme A dehydrogenase n=1 Tax=Lyngbya confervoides BDU141951 TaxID=1574623 RepID=A0ABD4T5V4_9CYAN|nr:acyl-CoA dehydrogenase [Lyngbya confervoides]MCM1984054.1 acyl-CoA dehydrogenase [Lyngbya confervoides BDU141951]